MPTFLGGHAEKGGLLISEMILLVGFGVIGFARAWGADIATASSTITPTSRLSSRSLHQG
jgi:hypothetical protein